MKVTLETKTDRANASVYIDCSERWTDVTHFDKALDTLRLARAWLIKQKAEKK